MVAWSRFVAQCFIVGIALLPLAGMTAGVAQPAGTDVPSRERVSTKIVNYSKIHPRIATAGLLGDGAIAELKSFGFATILDLRGPQEGTTAEKAAAVAAGLRYLNIPFTDAVPSLAQVAEFGRIVENGAHYPLMIHCASANRVGAMWMLYRLKSGVPLATAIAEGRAIGMQPPRENAVRASLGLPMLGR